ncbi:MAG: ETC complex I subunit [Methyloligellaceae bacterium]
MAARIFRPARTAMQSGQARTRAWILEFEPEARREVEPLMGWTSSRDMKSQIRMSFPTKEQAIAYAKKHGLAYQVSDPHVRKRRPKSYSDNFRFGRVDSWTH